MERYLGNTRKNQATRLVTLRYRSTMSRALGTEVEDRGWAPTELAERFTAATRT
jgi:hypothetical protein